MSKESTRVHTTYYRKKNFVERVKSVKFTKPFLRRYGLKMLLNLCTALQGILGLLSLGLFERSITGRVSRAYSTECAVCSAILETENIYEFEDTEMYKSMDEKQLTAHENKKDFLKKKAELSDKTYDQRVDYFLDNL